MCYALLIDWSSNVVDPKLKGSEPFFAGFESGFSGSASDSDSTVPGTGTVPGVDLKIKLKRQKWV